MEIILVMSRKVNERIAEADDAGVEARRVRRWRRRQFHALGFSLNEAYVLADASVDLGVARRMIAAGCPRETAIRILL